MQGDHCVENLGFFRRGVTLGTRASEVSEHWDWVGLGLRENEIRAFVARIWLEEGQKTTSK